MSQPNAYTDATAEARMHIQKFERDWMQELVLENPEVPEMDLYHDGIQAYIASEVGSKAVRNEICRMTGVLNNVDNY